MYEQQYPSYDGVLFARRLCRATEAWMAVGQEAQLRLIQSSPRGTMVVLVRTYLAPVPSSRTGARKSTGTGKRRTGRTWRTWGRLCGIPAATYGNVIRAFRRMLSCVFALLRNRPPRASASPSCTLTKGINVNAPCVHTRKEAADGEIIMIGTT